MKHLYAMLFLLCLLVMFTAVGWDFIDQFNEVGTDIKAMRDGCAQGDDKDLKDWCIKADGRGLLKWNHDTHAHEQVCDGVFDRLSYVYSVGVLGQGATDPDPEIWWRPKGDGHCEAVRVVVRNGQ